MVQRIPVQQQPIEQNILARGFLFDALETLLIGAVWVFVLLWVAYFQQLEGGHLGRALLHQAYQAQAAMVALLSGGLLLLTVFSGRGPWRAQGWRQTGLLGGLLLSAALQLTSFTLQFQDLKYLLFPLAIVQGLLGLALFLIRRKPQAPPA